MKKLSEITRKDLLKNGIYKITNIVNNKFYIGSCSSKTFLYERLIHHRDDLINNKHCNFYFQRSFNKYGIDSFYYEIIEICNPQECIIREQYWIDLLNPHYNLLKVAGSSFGRECKLETRKRISNANKKFWENEENRNKMKLANKNRIKKPKKIKIKKEFHGLCKAVIDLNTNITYGSVLDLSKAIKKQYTYLIAILNKKLKSSNINIEYVESQF
jgi:group I intron endonuclease